MYRVHVMMLLVCCGVVWCGVGWVKSVYVEWMNGWMNGWMDGWMDEWMDGLGAFDGAVLVVYFGEMFLYVCM